MSLNKSPYISLWARALTCSVVLIITACGIGKGGYYKDDGPPRRVKQSKIAKIPDAVPKKEPLSETGNNPYKALGKKYYPLKSANGYRERGVASWYGKKFHGKRTSSGEPYDMFAMTAAHRVLPLPSYVKVRNLRNGRAVTVKVNDRGPFLHNRVIDLSYAAAYKLGIVATGTGLVEVTAINPSVPSRQITTHQVPVSSRTVSGVKLFIQFGAFSVKSNAEGLQRSLYSLGFDPTMEHGLHDGRDIYRVRAGPYYLVSDVDQVSANARKYGYETKLVIE
ncbi:MAG: septal ring lytic transglycosylase RlpA family protein [Arenicellales bacterium]|nr:septal ring lytic transglycosylase RlpA family protein [Arenicellales bacterium]